MTERAWIELLSKEMPRHPKQQNGLFEADAEILPWGSEFLLFSTDEFSDEDMFLTKDGYALGHNIACAALSDVLATGGTPLYYAHSLTVDERFTQRYAERFSRGVADVLRQAGASFIGGDFGRAERWRCCASVIGRTDRPVQRSGAREGDFVYLTGPVGAGNLQAAIGLHSLPFGDKLAPDFTLRLDALEDIRRHATSCIDTSDGLAASVRTLARMSGCGFALENIPYHPMGKTAARLACLPLELLAFCECGEYELLFTSPQALDYPKIGRVTGAGITLEGRDISHMEISARSYGDMRAYLEEVKRLCEGL